jgi:hypothetical protein
MRDEHAGSWWGSAEVQVDDRPAPGDDPPARPDAATPERSAGLRGSGAVRRSVAIGAALVGAATVFAFASVQVRPSINEVAIVGVLYVALFLALAFAVPNRAIARTVWVTVPVLLLVAAVGTWNPWRLSAVRLAFGHPYLAAAFGAALVAIAFFHRTRDVPMTRWPLARILAVPALVGIFVGALVLAAVGLGRVPGPPLQNATAPGPGLRFDAHDELTMCRPSAIVVRTGTGLTMRERELEQCRDWAQVDGHLVGRACRPDEPYVDHVLTFDPDTLDVVEDRTVPIVEPPLEPNSARSPCGPPAG